MLNDGSLPGRSRDPDPETVSRPVDSVLLPMPNGFKDGSNTGRMREGNAGDDEHGGDDAKNSFASSRIAIGDPARGL